MTGQLSHVRSSRRHALRGRGLVAARLALAAGILVALVLAVPGSAFAASPHASAADQSTCSACHVPHQAATASGIFKDVGPVKGETPLCYTCHDGSAASSNIKTGSDSFAYGNGHILEGLTDTSTAADLTNSCSSCHKPHGDPALRPKLPASKVNSATVGTTGNVWCLACHDDAQSWYAKRGTYPALSTPTRDASGYPTVGTFAGASVYTSPTANAHISIPATASAGTTRTAGDCLYCHNAHGSASRYDSLSATLAPSTAASVASDRETGAYAALCFGCHGGGSWEASGAANIKQYVTDEATDTSALASGGHRIKSPGGTLPVDAPLPCYDCHNPHGSSRGNKRLISDALGGSLDTSAGPESVRRFCLTCHVTSDSFGWDSVSATYTAPPATSTVEGLKRNGGVDGSGPGGVGKNWLLLKVTPGHARADASTSCYECHGSSYSSSGSKNVHDPGAYSVALHTGTPTAATITILGVGYGPYACTTCHSVELGAEHAKPTSSSNASGCAECHPNPRSTLTPSWDRSTCAQGGCHTVASSAPMHSNVSTDHVAPANSCTVVGCHTASLGLASMHSNATTTVAGVTRTSCQVCHAPGVTPTSDCGASGCHPGVTGHGDQTANHASNITASWMTFFDDSAGHAADYSGAVDTYATCSMCHSTNLLTLHANDCSICHFGPSPPRETFGTWNKTCQQGGCHPVYHDAASSGHDGEYDYGDCDSCHTYVDYSNTWNGVATTDFCGNCHTIGADTTPPVSSANLLASYVGTASITLSATDDRTVRFTYYRIDGGTTSTVSGAVLVAPPAAGSQPHTIEYWSVDWSGNTETPHKSGIFSVAVDTVAPVTTSDAKPAYIGPATIMLTATDNATNFGVRSTYYRFDSGPVMTGTTAQLPQPLSGVETHTIYFWSVDYAGKVETPKSATFTVTADLVAPTTTPEFTHWWSPTQGKYLYVTDPAPSSGVKNVSITVSGGAVMNIWPVGGTNNLTWRTTFYTISTQGTRTVEYWAEDNAGNIESHVTTWLVLDWTPPVTTSNASASYSGAAVITLTATDTYSPIANTYWKDGSGGAQQSGTTATIAAPASGTVSHTLWFWSVDNAGNVEGMKSKTFNVSAAVADTTPPTGSVNINAGAVWTNSTTATLTLAAVDTGGSGLSKMRFSNDNSTWSTWENYSTPKVWSMAAGTGIKTVYVQYQDGAGNTSISYSDTISLELTAPVTTSNAVAGTTYSGNTTFTLSPTDAGGSGLAGSWWQLDSTIGTWTSGTSVPVAAPASGTVSHTIYWYSRDTAGNQEVQKSVTFNSAAVADTTPPTGSVTINAGAAWANSQACTLTLAASDTGGSGLSQMRFSNDNAAWSTWETYATPKTWSMSAGAGTKTVYVQYKDGAGNISSSYNDTIGLDPTAPVTTSSAVGGSTYTGTTPFTLAPVDSGGSGLSSTWWQLDSTSGAWTSGTSVVVTAPVSGVVSHTLYWYSRDVAGNQEAQKSVTFSVADVGTGPQTFFFTGAGQVFTVPVGVTTLTVDLYGGQGGLGGGGNGLGGLGGYVHATIPVTPGATLTIRVGGAGADSDFGGAPGWPNGGWGSSGSCGGAGGGSSSILSGTTILVEAGAGGGGDHDPIDGEPGGAAGWLPGGNQIGGDSNGNSAGGGGGWNAGAAGSEHDYSGGGGTSYIAAGTGTMAAGLNSGNGSIVIAWTSGSGTKAAVGAPFGFAQLLTALQ